MTDKKTDKELIAEFHALHVELKAAQDRIIDLANAKAEIVLELYVAHPLRHQNAVAKMLGISGARVHQYLLRVMPQEPKDA